MFQKHMFYMPIFTHSLQVYKPTKDSVETTNLMLLFVFSCSNVFRLSLAISRFSAFFAFHLTLFGWLRI